MPVFTFDNLVLRVRQLPPIINSTSSLLKHHQVPFFSLQRCFQLLCVDARCRLSAGTASRALHPVSAVAIVDAIVVVKIGESGSLEEEVTVGAAAGSGRGPARRLVVISLKLPWYGAAKPGNMMQLTWLGGRERRHRGRSSRSSQSRAPEE